MSNSFFSSSWHIVADLQPVLRGHNEIYRHVYRKQPVYVLQDHASGKCHRFNQAAYEVIGRLDGQRTIAEIWESVNDSLGNDAITQDDVIQLLAKLHQSDLLQSDSIPDSEEMFARYKQQRKSGVRQSLLNPLAIKLTVFDPDNLLDKLLPLAEKAFSKLSGLIASFAIMLAVFLAIMHWDKIVLNFSERLFEPFNLLLLVLTYPIVKGLHELGHALATKHWGGEVHDVGVTLLVFMPIPYVDATASWAFPEKKRRILVSAMGIIVELFLSSLALFIWLLVEPGLISSIAFNVLLIGSISTLLFNGNPLLKFDGYFVLQDLIETPNLAARSRNYIAYLIKRYVFNIEHIASPVSIDGERRWFVFYAFASSIYKLFILFFIAFFIVKKFFVIGVVLVAWVLFSQLIKPIYKQLQFLFVSPVLNRNRKRAISIVGFATTCVFIALVLVPVPNWTSAEGVIWPAQESQIRLSVSGFVEETFIDDGEIVNKGAPLFRLDNPKLRAEEKITAARLKEVKARYASTQFDQLTEANILKEEIEILNAELESIRNQISDFIVTSPSDGVFSLAEVKNIEGRYLDKGSIIAHVISHDETTALVVVSQRDAGIVREITKNVDVRLSQRIKDTHEANISREVPAASNRLPSKALGVMGGGYITVDDAEGLTSREPLFLFELTFEKNIKTNVGERVYVRFDHGKEPLAQQLYRASRQLLIKNLNV